MMGPKSFSIDDAYWHAWSSTKKHLWFLLGFTFFVLLFTALGWLAFSLIQQLAMSNESMIHAMLPSLKKTDWSLLEAGAVFAYGGAWVLQAFLRLSLLRVTLSIVDDDEPKEKFPTFKMTLYYLFAYFIYTVILLIGFILLIVPAVIWMLMFSLYPYYIIDRKAGPIEALQMSAFATKGAKVDLFFVGVISILLILLGLFCFGLGILIALPVVDLAWAVIYRHLDQHTTFHSHTMVLHHD